MNNARVLLPTVRNLIVFESAGRLLNFTAAAKELGMTQAAVSHSVMALEQQMSVQLFLREHRGVKLTIAGESFLTDVSLALSLIQKSATQLQSSSRTRTVAISTSQSFARYWLLPRLPRLRAEHPEIVLRILSNDEEIDTVSEDLSLSVRLAMPATMNHIEHRVLFPERVYAVCGADYAKLHLAPDAPMDMIESHALIEPDLPVREAVNWADWLESVGVFGQQIDAALCTSDQALALQAALDNVGIALACSSYVDSFLADGRLVRITDHVLMTGRHFQLVWPRSNPLSRNEQIVMDWIIDEAAGHF